MKRLLAIAALFSCSVGGAAYAQSLVPDTGSVEGFAFGVMAMLGTQVLLVIAMTSRTQRWIREQVDERMKDDESVFGKHRSDPLAHEAMRAKLQEEGGLLAAKYVRKDIYELQLTGLMDTLRRIEKKLDVSSEQLAIVAAACPALHGRQSND